MSRRDARTRRILGAALRVAAAAGLLGLTACREAASDNGAPAVLRLAGRTDVPTLDPAVGYDTTSWMFEDAIFSTLLDYDDDSRLVGELAESWHVSPDGRGYRFRLRSDAYFSNGRRVTAEDVKYSLERVLDPATRSQGTEFFRGIVGGDDCVAGKCSVAGIRVNGPTQVEIELREVDPLFLHKLAMQFGAVVPREETERWGEDFSRHAVGSGPFRLERWSSGQRLVLSRNPHFPAPNPPGLAGIEYLMGVDDDLAWFKFQAGQLDITDIPTAEFPRIIRSKRYASSIRKVVSMSTRYLGMNCEMAPFDDARVRRAMNFAVDKEKLLRLINRRGVAARGILPPEMPGYQPDLAGYPHDPERARGLLREAGLPSGFRSTLWIQVDDEAFRLAQAVQQDLREVGIDIEIRALAWGPFLEKVKTRGEVPLFLLGWQADFPDPSNFLQTLLHSGSRGANNSTFFSAPELDALLDQAAATVAGQPRMKLLQAAERLAVSAAPWVFLSHPVTYQLVQPRVRNFRLHPLRPPRFDKVAIEPEGQGVSGSAPPAS